jgi:hypothetical protein
MATVTITIKDVEDPNEVASIECVTDWNEEGPVPNAVLVGTALMKFVDALREDEEPKVGGTD